MATLVSVEQVGKSLRGPVEIEVPALTAWPLVLAFGFTLMFAGLLTSASVSVLGVVLAVAGCVGWRRAERAHPREEKVAGVVVEDPIKTDRRRVRTVAAETRITRAC